MYAGWLLTLYYATIPVVPPDFSPLVSALFVCKLVWYSSCSAKLCLPLPPSLSFYTIPAGMLLVVVFDTVAHLLYCNKPKNKREQKNANKLVLLRVCVWLSPGQLSGMVGGGCCEQGMLMGCLRWKMFWQAVLCELSPLLLLSDSDSAKLCRTHTLC